MTFFKKPIEAEIKDADIAGSTRERGERFIHAFMDALIEDESTFKVGYGAVKAKNETTQETKVLGAVVASINDKTHVFLPDEARKMADSMERTMNRMPFDEASHNDIMQDVIMALRDAAERVENVDVNEMVRT